MIPDVRRLDEFPVKDGFRLRGYDMTRIETFTDAAFAFALTLLVVSLDIPSSFDELTAALRGIPAFAISAVLLMVFWNGHHVWSRRYGLDDATTVLLSCLLVFIMLVYVYPLRFLARALTAWMDHVLGLPITSEPFRLGGPAELSQLFIIYGAGFVAMCVAILLLHAHAWRLRDELRLNELERHDTRADMGAWSILAATGILSIGLGIVFGSSAPALPGWAYMILPVVMPLYSARVNRRRKALRGDE